VTPIVGFVAALRDAGVRVSVAESLEAMRALELVGYDDRALVRDALGLVLAKTAEEKALFGECFDRYFAPPSRRGNASAANGDPADGGGASGREASPGADGRRDASSPTGDGGRTDASRAGGGGREAPAGAGGGPGTPDASLADMLERGDAGGLETAIELAARDVRIDAIRYPTQRNMTMQRMLERLGEDALLREIAEQQACAARGDERAGERAARLERARADLRERVRERVDRRLALAEPANRRRRDETLAATPLRGVDRADVARMRVLARAIARRLALRFGRVRKRRRRGLLDVRKTIRRATAYGGVPFAPAWKRRKLRKPRLFVLCDVSGSVAAVAEFLLLVVYGLTEALDGIRSFAFTGRLFEVSDIFESQTIEEAIPRVLREAGFGSSDYGGSLADFTRGWLGQLDRRTAILVLGDARSNFGDPRVDLLELIRARAGRLIWLNPEHRSSWGTGDSEMLRYLPHCDVARVCASLTDLEHAVAALLAARR